MSLSSTTLETPRQYQGVFERTSKRYLPLLEDARATLREYPVPDFIRDDYLSIVEGRAQPAFILFPLMYLDLADATGGLTERQRAYLPWQMLAMELIALYDDTVDQTPQRSGAPTYTHQHGPAAATALSGFLFGTLVERTAEVVPELSALLTKAFENLCARGLWEHQSRYPEVSVDSFAAWMRKRNDAIPPIIAYTLDGCLLLQQLGPIPEAARATFGDLMQDVDDLVNIVEARENQGENDDLKMGIPSYPLLATIRADPSARRLLDELWSSYRLQQTRSRPISSDDDSAANEAAHRELVALVRHHGVSETTEKVIRDAERVVTATPHHARAAMREYAFSVVDRLRDCDPRASIARTLSATTYSPEG
ncbi:MAG: hypothetical protein HOV80_10780 [Polyangiaceae bacterium]|nr:hypothetical protein [Polyangiaceae bacterium]